MKQLELDMNEPMLITGSNKGKEWVTLKMKMVNGEYIGVPMHILTAYGIGASLVEVSKLISIETGVDLAVGIHKGMN